MSHEETALWQALAPLQRLGSRLRTLDYRLGLGLSAPSDAQSSGSNN